MSFRISLASSFPSAPSYFALPAHLRTDHVDQRHVDARRIISHLQRKKEREVAQEEEGKQEGSGKGKKEEEKSEFLSSFSLLHRERENTRERESEIEKMSERKSSGGERHLSQGGEQFLDLLLAQIVGQPAAEDLVGAVGNL